MAVELPATPVAASRARLFSLEGMEEVLPILTGRRRA
jgi:hypothetical protein